jgi:flagellar hook-associated protein 3 FlgL
MLGTTDSTLNNVTNLLTRVFERAGFALNGTLKQTDRDGIAAEIRQIQEEIVRISSTKVNGKYIFSGSQVDTEPLLFTAGSYQYQGDDRALMIEISQGESIQVNATGAETFTEPVTDVVNVLTTLISQLEASDLDGARQSLETIYAAGEAINVSRVRVGTSMSRLDDAKTGLDNEFLQLMTRMSDLEDVDMAEAISGLVQAETGLQTTLSVGSRLHQLNLFDLLG